MKKILCIAFNAFLLSLVVFNVSNAQHTGNASASQHQTDVFPKNIEKLFSVDSSSEFRISKVSTKAIRHFTKYFSKVENVHWYNADDGMVAYFTQNGIKTRADYDKRGNWLHTVRTYTEKYLPKNIRAQVKSEYYDFAINCVNEINTGRQLIYVILIEDEDSYKNLRLEDGAMEVLRQYVKK